ncbi:hypothetical protein PV08_09386 [Exophiala spinifera]|uniref:Uncharacterized protein n=1 Tax=Exophiala spinifera TaxID=91928 RepID=A0A0D1ZGL4_9EURO|nr:uncharacterized protein PV08_09386 [Exophiala spinifera]KIW12112.1 hypothetical protein PV08_09386 [Exophiala spinifera]
MDPFSITSGALQIAGACAQVTITIIKWVGDVRTVDARISSFCDEVAALQTTYEGLERSLSSPLVAEAARVASKTSDGSHLWRQIKETLDDSRRTIQRVNDILDNIVRTSGFGRKFRAHLQESLSSGELSRLRQRIQVFNTTLSLPIQMVCVMLQLEQRDLTSDHQASLDAKLTGLENSVKELVRSLESRSHSQSLSSATIVATDPEVLRPEDDIDTYITFAKKFLATASAAASTRSSLSTVSPGMEPDVLLNRRKLYTPELPQPLTERERLTQWIPEPSIAIGHAVDAEDDTEIHFMRTKRHLNLGQERVEKGNNAEAETHLRKAIALMEKHDFDGRISLHPADVVLMLADACVKQEKLEEAINLLKPVAAMREDIFPVAREVIETMTKPQLPPYQQVDKLQALAANHMLGQVFKLKSDYESAEDHALKAFMERRKELGPQDAKTLESVQLVIDIYRAQGDKEEAEGYEVFLLPTETSPKSVSREPSTSSLEEPLLNQRMMAFESKAAPVQPQPIHRNSLSSLAQRLRHFGRSPQASYTQFSTAGDLQRLSISRSTTLNNNPQDIDTEQPRNDCLRSFGSPSDASTHDRSMSIYDDDSVNTPSTGIIERSSRTIESTFLAISQLCAEKNLDRATKVALQFLDTYHSNVMVIRKMELEKNIRRGSGQGLARTGRGYAPLHFFCELKKEHAEEVHLLIQHGVNVNAVAYQAGYTESNPKNAFTALQAATDRGYSTITSLLISCKGIKTEVRNAEGFTPLMVACRRGHYAIVKQLLAFPLPTEFPHWHGNTLLHDAARRCDPKLVEMLIDFHPDLNARDTFGKTALMHALTLDDVIDEVERKGRDSRRCKTVKILLEAGADSTLRDNRTNLGIRDIAFKSKDPDLLTLLDRSPRVGVSELLA